MGLLAGFILATTFGGGSATAAGHITGVESLSTDKAVVDLVPGTSRSKEEVFFRGAGFTPGTEVFILLEDGNGVLTDITVHGGNRRDGGSSVSPLIANSRGAFATSWRVGRFTRNNVGGEAMDTVWAVDTSFNNLATAPLALCDVSGREKYLAGNEDATVIGLHNLASAAIEALEADFYAVIGYTSTNNLAADAVKEVLEAFPKASIARVGADTTVKFVTVPSWCSSEYIPSKGGGF
jgi:hypothetical protein